MKFPVPIISYWVFWICVGGLNPMATIAFQQKPPIVPRPPLFCNQPPMPKSVISPRSEIPLHVNTTISASFWKDSQLYIDLAKENAKLHQKSSLMRALATGLIIVLTTTSVTKTNNFQHTLLVYCFYIVAVLHGSFLQERKEIRTQMDTIERLLNEETNDIKSNTIRLNGL
jgi:hypothetical protein